MKKKFFLDHFDTDKDEEAFIEIPVKTKYILCFPPREIPAGNFFSQAKSVILWKPCEKGRYGYEPSFAGEKEEERKTQGRIRIGDTVCIFMEHAPETKKLDLITRKWIDWKVKRLVREIEEDKAEKWEPNYKAGKAGKRDSGYERGMNKEGSRIGGIERGPDKVCDVYRMEHRQDYPYSLRLHFAERFLENMNFGKKTRIGIVEGDMLKRRDLIALIRNCYDKMNFLTIFSREGAEYRELVEDAWEQYGLAVTVTPSFGELTFCDYVLDCTRMPFEGSVRCRKGCSFFSLLGDQKKIKSLRRAGGEISFDSCANILDRTFHNRV